MENKKNSGESSNNQGDFCKESSFLGQSEENLSDTEELEENKELYHSDIIQEDMTEKKKKKGKRIKNKEKQKKRWAISLITGFLLFVALFYWKSQGESHIRWIPDYEMSELPSFFKVSQLSSEQLLEIYRQTGVSEVGLLRLEEQGRLEELEVFQRAFFLEGVVMESEDLTALSYPLTTLPIFSEMNSPISWEEWVVDFEGNRGAYLPMVPLSKGDVLLTPSSYCFGFRQGHAALVIEEDTTLESVVLGTNSKFQWAGKWQGFPAVVILRPKEEEMAERAVEFALSHLVDIPYVLTIGVFSDKYLGFDRVWGTNCSHLVWQAYEWAGIDIDGNGGRQVLPQDMGYSSQLEVVQIWGINPEEMWNYLWDVSI